MRYITRDVQQDLAHKMVFVAGPRQAGKTTLAKEILAAENHPLKEAYFNWDSDLDRRRILARNWDDHQPLIVFDELHKYNRWKQWLKGLYDTTKERHNYLVTGSARLDIFRRGGDSMLGRYHLYRLHPFTLQELPDGMQPADAFTRLLTFGGFPEPFLSSNVRLARRWRRERFERILKDDVRDLERVAHLTQLEFLVQLLQQRVSGVVVAANLASDLEVAPRTVQRWLDVLERMYVLFQVKPYSRRLARAIRKPPKIYFYDNGDVQGDEGAVFENLVATHLLKRIHYLEDREGYRYELRYVRDKEGREVDFVVLKDGRVDELWEAKWADETPSKHLMYFAERLQPRRAYQVVAQCERARTVGNIHVVPYWPILSRLDEVL